MYKDSKSTLDEFAIDLSTHKSAKIDKDTARRASIILALDTKTLSALRVLFPDQTAKMFLISELVHEKRDIVDPEGVNGAAKQRHIFSDLKNIIVTGLPRLAQLIDEAETQPAAKRDE